MLGRNLTGHAGQSFALGPAALMPRSRRILRLHDRSPVKRDKKALDRLLHHTRTRNIRSLHQRNEHRPQSGREILDLSRKGRNRLSQPPISWRRSHLDSSRPHSPLHAQRPTRVSWRWARWKETTLNAQQTPRPPTTFPECECWRSVSSQEIL